MKKITEYLLTFAGIGIIASGCVFAMGCADVDTEKVSKNLNNVVDNVSEKTNKVDDLDGMLVLADIASMENGSSCLGYVSLKSKNTDCYGRSTSSFNGCVDCFGITVSEEKTAEDYTYVNDCMGCYIVSIPFTSSSDGEVRPIYGCYTGKN